MKFFGSDVWKPVQTGIQLSTRTVTDMHLVVSGDSKLLLTSHLNQDAVENVFSQVRGKGATHPRLSALSASGTICVPYFVAVHVSA